MKTTHCRKLFFLLALFLFALSSCKDKDENFERPAWLSGPIYTKLGELGNCTYYMQCLDRTPYAKLLNSTSTYTVFVPSDSAFKVFMAEKGYQSVADIPQKWIDDYVRFSIIDFGYSVEFIDRSAQWGEGWVLKRGDSWRRKTMYQGDVTVEDYSSISPNWPGPLYIKPNFNKTAAYLTERYCTNNLFTAADYSTIYPGQTLGKFNYFEATVIKPDVVAENGYIHVTDKVVELKRNVYDFIASKPQYSLFKSLLDRLIYPRFLGYEGNASGDVVAVYTKTFTNPNSPTGEGWISFNLCDETFLATNGDNPYQTDMSAIFVPTNEYLSKFLNEQLLVKYGSIDKVSREVIAAYINGLIQQQASRAWPSRWPLITNNFGDPIPVTPSDIADVEICSNGIFYGVNNAMVPGFISSSIGFAYLSEEYKMFNYGIESMQLRDYLSKKELELTVFAVKDAAFDAYGIKYNPSATGKGTDYKIYKEDGGLKNDASYEFGQLVKLHIAFGKITNTTTREFLRTLSDETILVEAGKVYGAGNTDVAPASGITIGSKQVCSNGLMYELFSPILPSDQGIGKKIISNAAYSEFRKLLEAAELITTDGVISSNFIEPTVDYTVFIPTNGAILAEKANGAGNRIPTDKTLLKEYLKNYFIPGNLFYTTDADFTRSYNTLYVKEIDGGSPIYATLNLQLSGGVFSVTDMTGGNATTTGITDAMTFHGVIHQINNMLNIKPSAL